MKTMLKPCPFCGNRAKLIYIKTAFNSGIYQVVCSNATCNVATFGDREKLGVIAVWNRRTESEENND